MTWRMMTWRMMTAMAGWLLAMGSAHAVEQVDRRVAGVDVKVADDVSKDGGLFSGFDYGTSGRLGNAWLVLHYRYEGPCDDSEGTCHLDVPVRVRVPGLTYDAAARRVTYQEPGAEPVVCATVRPHGGFLGIGERIAATGSCTYRLVKVDRLIDDGFAGQRDRREEVHFVVPVR